MDRLWSGIIIGWMICVGIVIIACNTLYECPLRTTTPDQWTENYWTGCKLISGNLMEGEIECQEIHGCRETFVIYEGERIYNHVMTKTDYTLEDLLMGNYQEYCSEVTN